MAAEPQNKWVYNLRKYAISGCRFPKTNDEFERELPQAGFKQLHEIDPKLFSDTRTTSVTIGVHCCLIKKEHINTLANVNKSTQKTANEVKDSLEEATLQDHIGKMKNRETGEEDYKTAKESAQQEFEKLEVLARQNKENIEMVAELMENLETSISNSFNDMISLKAKYGGNAGIITSQVGPQYFDVLIRHLHDGFRHPIEQSGDIDLQWLKDNTLDIILGPPVSRAEPLIPSMKTRPKMTQTALAKKKLRKKINRTKREGEVRFIKNVKAIIGIYDDLSKETEAAIKALSNIYTNLRQQADAYDQFAEEMKSLKLNLMECRSKLNHLASLTINQMRAERKIREAINLSETLKEAIKLDETTDYGRLSGTLPSREGVLPWIKEHFEQLRFASQQASPLTQ